MAVENKPAVSGDSFIKGALDAVAVDIVVDQRGGAKELQVRDARVNAGNDAAGLMENFRKLGFTPHRSRAIRISEILDSNRRIEREQITAIFRDLGGKLGGIEIGRSQMRESMAGDLMALQMQRDDAVIADALPMTAPCAGQVDRNIERRFRVMLFEKRGSYRCRALGKIVERKADHRVRVAHPKRQSTKMPRQTVVDAHLPCRPVGARGHFLPGFLDFLTGQAGWCLACEITEPVSKHCGGRGI